MRKLILMFIAACTLVIVLSVSSVANAAFDPFEGVCSGVPVAGDEGSSVCADKANTGDPLSGSDGLLLKIVGIVTFITGMASIIIIILGGLKYVTSNGDSNSINSAKNTILYAIIGLVVSLLSRGIIVFVINRLN